MKTINLIEVLSIGEDDGDRIYQWAGVTTDESENIYLTDLMDYSVKKFDRNGNLISTTGGKGKGPGEFMAPTLIAYLDGKIYVTERSMPGIQVFEAGDLQFKARIPFRYPIVSFSLKSENDILVSSFIPGKSGSLIGIDSLGREQYVHRLGTEEEVKLSTTMMDMVELLTTGNHEIIIAFSWQDIIQRIDLEGRMVWQQSLYSGKKTELISVAGLKYPKRPVHKGLALDSRGNIFVLGGQFASKPGRDVYVLSEHGRLIGIATLPESSHMIYIDNDDHLFARSGMGTILKKYEIQPF